MKQVIIYCFTITTVFTSFVDSHEATYPSLYAHIPLELIDLGEHLPSKAEIKAEYPEGFIFGHGYISGLQDHVGSSDRIKSYPEHPLDLSVGEHLTSAFEKNLLFPELPKVIPSIKTSIAGPSAQLEPASVAKYVPRYTKTSIQTYEVKEDTYDPVPVPKIANFSFVAPTPDKALFLPQIPIQVDNSTNNLSEITVSSGLLQVLGAGKEAGSGVLTYAGNQSQVGGLQEVAPPALGNAPLLAVSDTHANQPALNIQPEAFPAATPFDFNSLHAAAGQPDFSFLTA